MSPNVSQDQFVVIRVEGMHCHQCEKRIQTALLQHRGVHEVEVDFNSGQASVLFDPAQARVSLLVESVRSAGYHTTGFTQGQVKRSG